MRPREVVVYATKIDSRGRKVKTYPPDRHCEICDAPLSRYNPATYGSGLDVVRLEGILLCLRLAAYPTEGFFFQCLSPEEFMVSA